MLLLPLLTFDHSVSVYTSAVFDAGQTLQESAVRISIGLFSPKKVFFCPLPTEINSKQCISLEYGGFHKGYLSELINREFLNQ